MLTSVTLAENECLRVSYATPEWNCQIPNCFLNPYVRSLTSYTPFCLVERVWIWLGFKCSREKECNLGLITKSLESTRHHSPSFSSSFKACNHDSMHNLWNKLSKHQDFSPGLCQLDAISHSIESCNESFTIFETWMKTHYQQRCRTNKHSKSPECLQLITYSIKAPNIKFLWNVRGSLTRPRIQSDLNVTE